MPPDCGVVRCPSWAAWDPPLQLCWTHRGQRDRQQCVQINTVCLLLPTGLGYLLSTGSPCRAPAKRHLPALCPSCPARFHPCQQRSMLLYHLLLRAGRWCLQHVIWIFHKDRKPASSCELWVLVVGNGFDLKHFVLMIVILKISCCFQAHVVIIINIDSRNACQIVHGCLW